MIKFSIHTEKRIAERNLSVDWIERTISAPDWARPDADPSLTQSFKAIVEFGNRILKVVHRPDGADILVITTYFDRSAKR